MLTTIAAEKQRNSVFPTPFPRPACNALSKPGLFFSCHSAIFQEITVAMLLTPNSMRYHDITCLLLKPAADTHFPSLLHEI